MAGGLMGGGGTGRRGRRARYTPLADINVTPLVDVSLVLLIVFMVTAPMLTVGVPLDLPKTKASNISQDKEPLVVSVDAKGLVYLQESMTPLEMLVVRLRAVTGANPDTRILVRGDKGVPYGRVMEVMGAISAAGYTKVAMLAELPVPNASSSSSADEGPKQARPARR